MERGSQGHRPVDRSRTGLGLADEPVARLQLRRAVLSAVLASGTGACSHMRLPEIGKSDYPIGTLCRGVNCRKGPPSGIFHQAQVRFAKLNIGNLSGADLRDSDLAGVVLRGADLRGARLKGANLADADLDGALLVAGLDEPEGSGFVPGPGAR